MAGVKLAECARANCFHPQTAYRWLRQGRMPVPARRLPSGTILVQASGSGVPDRGAVVSARVSAHHQRPDLDRQVARLSGWAAGHGGSVAEVVTEVGWGLNGRRPKLARLLADPRSAGSRWSIGTGWPGSAFQQLEAALSAQAAGWWWSTPRRPPRTWWAT